VSDTYSAPLLSVIIPVLHLTRPINAKRFFMPRYTIREVLRDLREHVTLPFEVIVICNGTDPELIEFVRTHNAIDKYCINSVNAGVGRSWNMGAQLAEAEVLCFLNDDVAVGRGGMEALYHALLGSADVGEVGPAGSRWRGAQHERYAGEQEPEDADVISGFCFLLKSELFHQLGGLDIAYTPAGFEEIDLSFAIRKAGYRCLVIPKLPIHHYHHHGVSAYRTEIKYLKTSIDTHVLHQRNKTYFMKKWGISDEGVGE
jgi:GT2 family glycosyltransferase